MFYQFHIPEEISSEEFSALLQSELFPAFWGKAVIETSFTIIWESPAPPPLSSEDAVFYFLSSSFLAYTFILVKLMLL